MAFKRMWILLAALLCVAAMPVAAADNCPFLPDYEQLRQQLPNMAAAEVVAALERYSRSHENPEACEAIEIDRQLGVFERQLFTLGTSAQALPRIAAHAVYRCNRVDLRTARCDGPVEDGTAHPMSLGEPSARLQHVPLNASFRAELRGSKLYRVYLVSLADALDGRAARRMVTRQGQVRIPDDARNVAIIAIYRTSGSPWRFRKAVWWVL